MNDATVISYSMPEAGQTRVNTVDIPSSPMRFFCRVHHLGTGDALSEAGKRL